jgi:hypothetical protein
VRVTINATGEAHPTLTRLRIERAITSFETNFHSSRELEFAPQVAVWIEDRDEMAMERTRRWVLAAIDPLVRGTVVTVHPGSANG